MVAVDQNYRRRGLGIEIIRNIALSQLKIFFFFGTNNCAIIIFHKCLYNYLFIF